MSRPEWLCSTLKGRMMSASENGSSSPSGRGHFNGQLIAPATAGDVMEPDTEQWSSGHSLLRLRAAGWGAHREPRSFSQGSEKRKHPVSVRLSATQVYFRCNLDSNKGQASWAQLLTRLPQIKAGSKISTCNHTWLIVFCEKAEFKKYFLGFWMQVMPHHNAVPSQVQPDRSQLYTRS